MDGVQEPKDGRILGWPLFFRTITMRRIIARTTGLLAYEDPGNAIRASREIDSRERTVLDAQVCGKKVHRVFWADAALVMQLDNNEFLNCIGQNRRIICSLDTHPIAHTKTIPNDTIRLEMDGNTIEWHRAYIASKYSGKVLQRLWCGVASLYVYFEDMPILACHAIESCPEGRTLLFWTESE